MQLFSTFCYDAAVAGNELKRKGFDNCDISSRSPGLVAISEDEKILRQMNRNIPKIMAALVRDLFFEMPIPQMKKARSFANKKIFQ